MTNKGHQLINEVMRLKLLFAGANIVYFIQGKKASIEEVKKRFDHEEPFYSIQSNHKSIKVLIL